MIDLHIHTTSSDGQYTPLETMLLAARENISAISITDHDTIAGIKEGALAAREYGVEFIPGIEISVKGNRELHILGYCINTQNLRLSQMCEEFALFRREREQRIFQYLAGKGVVLSVAQVEKYAGHDRKGRPHFARAMLEAGYVPDYRAAFDLYLATPEFDSIERPKPGFREGISVIREAGGVAVLAHPAQLNLHDEQLEALLQELLQVGLQGMECYYSTHTKEQTVFYLSLAKRYNLLVTGGSDFHGEKVKPDIQIGTGVNNSLCFNDTDIVEKLWEASRN